jgi:uncharacterized protein involved in cysteine biosynthesis
MNRPTELAAEAGQQAWTRPAVIVPVFVLVSAIGGFFPSFSPAANLYVLLVGGTLFWLGMSGRVTAPQPAVAPLGSGVLWWLLPLTVLVVAELVNFALGSTPAHPTLSLLADPLLDHYLPRALAYYGWLVGFWGVVRR